MNLSKKQIKQIKQEYPGKPVGQLSKEMNLSENQLYKALGLKTELWSLRFENITGYLSCLLLLIAPFVVIKGLSDFADLPQRAFIQAVSVCLLLVWLYKATVQVEINICKNPVYLFGAGFVLWSSISLFWAHSLYEGCYSAIHWATCAIVFFVISTVLCREKWIELLLTSSFLATVGIVLLGLGQQFFKLDWVPMLQAPAATFANANMASQYVVITLPLVLAVGFYQQRILFKYAALIVAVLSLVFLFYTRCRAAWVAVACALVWTALLLARKKLGSGFAKRAFPALLVAVIALTVIGFKTGGFNGVVKKAGRSAVYRVVVWQNSLEMIKEKPVLGFGAGQFKVFYPNNIYKVAIDKAFDKDTQIRRAHNDYIQAGVELGVAGLLAFIALPLYGLYMAWKLISCEQDFKFNVVVTGISAGIISFMATAVFSFPFQRSIPPLLLFTYIGILTAIYNRQVLHDRILKLKLPKALGFTAVAILLIAGLTLVRYNWQNSNCDRFFRVAMSMEKKGANKAALKAGLTANKFNPHRMDVLSAVGRAYVTTGNPDKGIEVLEKVTQLYPYHLNALFILGVAYANTGNQEKFFETFRRVLKIQPDYKDAKKIVSILKVRGKIKINLS